LPRGNVFFEVRRSIDGSVIKAVQSHAGTLVQFPMRLESLVASWRASG